MTLSTSRLNISDAMIEVMRVLMQADQPIGCSEITAQTGRASDTVYGILTALTERGWLHKTPRKNRRVNYYVTYPGHLAITWILNEEDNPECGTS